MEEKTKEKISNTLKKKIRDKIFVPNMIGAHSKKSREKQSISKTGKKESEEHKANISNSLLNSDIFLAAIKNPKRSEKFKQTCLEKYGVENPAQDLNIFFKTQKSGFKLKKYMDTNIYYRGSYELDFLEKYYNKYPDIKNAPSIKYSFEGRNKVYFPDFYIPSLNLIVECKNSYLLKKDKEIIESKKKATILKGYKYLMIVDKNYYPNGLPANISQ